VSGYTTLKMRGGRWVGLCPFHKEKTPSFGVSTDKQLYHCFGCGAGGGIVQFIMQAENLSFRESVAFLANRAGLAMPEVGNDERHQLLGRLVDINKDAARFFHEQLKKNEHAKQYIASRRLSPLIIKQFGVGYAPHEWDALLKHLVDKGYDKADIEKAGLIVPNKKGGYYDRFRHRIMFPIFDIRKRVIAFSGRAVDRDENVKYINSPETPLFSKSRELYALHEAKNTRGGRIILAEGQMDVLALYQAGFDYAVASSGTAFTSHHAQAISRYAKEAIIAFDTDGAGQAAAAKAAPILQSAGLNVRVLSLQDAKDPDEFIQRKGRDAFAALLDGAQTHSDHSLAQLARQHDLEADAGRVAFLKDATQFIARLKSRLEREIYIGRVAQMTDVSVQVVAAEVEQLYKRSERNELRARGLTVGNADMVRMPSGNVRRKLAEEGIITCLLAYPELWDAIPFEMTAEQFHDEFLRSTFAQLSETRGGITTLELDNAQSSLLSRWLQKPLSLATARESMADYVRIVAR